MRLPEEDAATATLVAALDAGITLFDTARAYDGNEQLLARALRGTPARVITKGGMRRDRGLWLADGRAKSLRADCEASLDALDGLPVELYLVHAPDARTPWATTVRALARLADDGLVTRVGVSNVNRKQLDEAVELAPVAAVEIAVSPFDDKALRGGVVDRCAELGIEVIAHSPLGGPRRAPALGRQPALVTAAEAHDATPAEVALAWLLALGVVPIPGARNPQAARSAARAASLRLDPEELARLDDAFGRDRRSAPGSGRAAGADVVLVMGTPGAGKTRIAEQYATHGYRRLNRDERGGSLRELAAALDEELAGGARRVVLDNTYLSRAERSRVVEIAARHRGSVRCVWLDTPLAQAQVNLVERLLDRFGRLPEPEELRSTARREPGLLLPTSQMRAFRELEPPERDEGFASVERIAFVREARPGRAGVFVAATAMRSGWTPHDEAPHLLFDWVPNGDAGALAELAARLPGATEAAVCPHGGGPPACWCRPPLPGLLLAFARAHDVDPARSVLVGTSAAHRTLAATLGAGFVSAE